MDSLFSSLTLADVHEDVVRNIVSLRASQDLFDDLTDDPDGWRLAQHVEHEVKPPMYQSATPAIHRPFEDAQWFNAISYPFDNWQASRFSDGSFGVWYGAGSVETSVHETAYHWYKGLLSDAGFENETVIAERQVYSVRCDAALLDFRPAISGHPDLIHESNYAYTHAVGARIHREGHPGLINPSVRHPDGDSYAVLNAAVLSNPRIQCFLTYRLREREIIVEREPDVVWLKMVADC